MYPHVCKAVELISLRIVIRELLIFQFPMSVLYRDLLFGSNDSDVFDCGRCCLANSYACLFAVTCRG